MAPILSSFITASQLIAALNNEDPAKIGSALVQLRHVCSIQPLPAVITEYLALEPAANSVFNVLHVARESNSIHLLANCLYTLSYLISKPSTSPFESNRAIDASRIINHLIENHSKSIHRCFAPARTEATLACLSLLIACVSWNDGACAKLVIADLRWDNKTVFRLLNTRQSVTAPSSKGFPKSGSNNRAPKSTKLKGQLDQVDVRTMMLRFILSIISNTELRPSIKLEFWKTKGLADGVMKGLLKDSYESVAFVLAHLWDSVVRKDGWTTAKSAEMSDHARFIPHSRWEVFDQNAVAVLVQLLDRDDNTKDIQSTKLPDSETIAHMAEKFLTNLTQYICSTIPTNVFQTYANSRLPQYRLLLNLIKTCAPTKSLRRWRLILHILRITPSLCSILWRTAAPAAEPSATAGWISSVGFATQVASMPISIPLEAKYRAVLASANKSLLINIASNLSAQCIPTPLTRLWFTKTIQHPNGLVMFSSLSMLSAGLKKARDISRQLELAIQHEETGRGESGSRINTTTDSSAATSNPWSKLLGAFHRILQSILPDAQVLIAALHTISRRVVESNGTTPVPLEHPPDEPQPKTVTKGSQEDDVDSDVVSFHILAVLLMYHELMPQIMYDLNFDYAKLIPMFLKLSLSEEPGGSQTNVPLSVTHQIHSAVTYLCQSRVLRLIRHSASNYALPSPTLLKYLLALSSTPRTTSSGCSSNIAHVPLKIQETAHGTLRAICESCVPHLKDEYEAKEIDIWIRGLSELRRTGEDVTPVITFLDDCIRACLRNPLKHIDICNHHRKLCPQLSDDAGVPLLLASLLSKLTAVTKASSAPTLNPTRVALISLMIKFLDLYAWTVLSVSHQSRPLTLVYHISSQLGEIFNPLYGQATAPSSYPNYMGMTVIDLLRSVTRPMVEDARLTKETISWPSHITQSSFSDQLSSLNYIHRRFPITKQSEKASFRTKKKVSLIDFGSAVGPESRTKVQAQSNEERLGCLRFLTRAFEVNKSSVGDFAIKKAEKDQSTDGSLNLEPLSYKDKAFRIKALLDIIVKCLSDDPVLIEEFMRDEEVWHVAQLAVEQSDFALLLDILRPSCSSLRESEPGHDLIIARYADLIDGAVMSHHKSNHAPKKDFEQDHTLLRCASAIFPLLRPTNQAKVLVSILSNVDHSALADGGCAAVLSKLIGTAMEWAREQRASLDRFSTTSVVETLVCMSRSSNAEPATDMLSLLAERLPVLQTSSEHPAAFSRVWHTYGAEALEQNLSDLDQMNKKLRIVAVLAKKSQPTYSAAINWLAQSSMAQLKSSWGGSLSLLVACLEVSQSNELAASWKLLRIVEHMSKARLEEFMAAIGSCLFSENAETSKSIAQGQLNRTTASMALKLLHSCDIGWDLDALIAHQVTPTDLVPAYAEALQFLRETRSSHLEAYVARCLRWLVRRLAEDEELSSETEALSQSLGCYLSHESSRYSLPAHLVNPVLSAALDRWISVGFVMKLVDSLIRCTRLEETDALKHVRAIVESRSFRSMMSTVENDEDQDVHVMTAINRLVMACPTVATKVDLSINLIPYYGGTLSTRDRLTFRIFRIEELWTETSHLDEALLAWNPKVQAKATAGRPFNFVTLLDSDKLEATCVWVLRKQASKHTGGSQSYYDPSFLLALFLQALESGPIPMLMWHSIGRVGLLGLAICALSSDQKTWRLLGDRCLARSHDMLKALDHTDASEMLLPLEHFRRLHVANETSGTIATVPTLITLFLARCLKLFCATPESDLHPCLSRFLLQRSLVDSTDVPMLYGLLYSSADMPLENHMWLMELLRDGLNTTTDWRIMDHRQTFEILITMVLSSTNHAAPTLRLLLLQLIGKATGHNQPCVKLITKSALVHVLRHLKPASKMEWREVMKIMQHIVPRLPLLRIETAADTVENIVLMLEEASKQRFEIDPSPLVIVRALLAVAPSWLSSSSRNQLVNIKRLLEHLTSDKEGKETSMLAVEVGARLVYLNQSVM